MSLPIELASGLVAIYGNGSATGITGISAPQLFAFGVIEQVSQYNITWASAGQSVMFKGADAVCKLAVNGWPYPIIEESKLIFQEIVPP